MRSQAHSICFGLMVMWHLQACEGAAGAANGGLGGDSEGSAEDSGGHRGDSDSSGPGGPGAENDGAASSDGDSAAPGPDWATEVHPFLVLSCGSCHMADPPITPYVGPGAFGDPDPATAHAAALLQVVPGQPEQSRLYIKVAQEEPVTGGMRMPMPPVPPLGDDSVGMIRDWIAAGALGAPL